MKCKAKIIYTRKGKIYMTFDPILKDEEIANSLSGWPEKELKNIELYCPNGMMYQCQGKIIGEISAEDEPTYQEEYSSYASLGVKYKCNECGHTYYSQLPNEYNINEWFNKILDSMN